MKKFAAILLFVFGLLIVLFCIMFFILEVFIIIPPSYEIKIEKETRRLVFSFIEIIFCALGTILMVVGIRLRRRATGTQAVTNNNLH
jgi:hypothetical protein